MEKLQVLELTGYKSLKALNAFHMLLLGLKMIPTYENITYEQFYENFKLYDDATKESYIREAIVLVSLEQSEVEALISFCCDKNGVPFSAFNMKNMKPNELHEAMVAVCMEIGRIQIDLLSADEKKSFQPSQLT